MGSIIKSFHEYDGTNDDRSVSKEPAKVAATELSETEEDDKAMPQPGDKGAVVKLTLIFGKEQEEMVITVLNNMKSEGEVVSYTKHDAVQNKKQSGYVGAYVDAIKFEISFPNAYCVYLFGHNQANLKS